jgi:sulfoxide reductase heme-binding subunit YedZ
VDPVREITTRTGKTALILLILSLACTPLGTLFGFKQALRVRRALGLYAFMYASLHFATFVGLDYGFDLALLRQAIFDQRYVLAGFAAGLLLLAMAITSTQGWQKLLGKNWKRLHRLAYLAGILAVVHFIWLVKDVREPLRYAAVLTALLVLRLPPSEEL